MLVQGSPELTSESANRCGDLLYKVVRSKLAHRQNLRLAWEDAGNLGRTKRSVTQNGHRTDTSGMNAMTCGAQAENHFTDVSLL